ncbi:acyl-CoA Delta-9 desaturase-like [Cylas formicarius]|uniref:acyl-CoA Delta-9 desaturase-like n=1 Tax=Cylas formicarius TaxID=197179 RepID=UPI002958B6A1|nr:acyl-CoA Delta-9 desaturase-like [Cylas formicarius]
MVPPSTAALANVLEISTQECKIDHVKVLEAKPNIKNSQKSASRGEYKCFLGSFKTPLIWTNIIGLIILHLGAIYGLTTHDYINKWKTVIYGFILGGISGFGVTGGAHRYWTHKCFKAKLPLKIILLVCYSVAGQNTLKEWVRDHRVHHKFSETDADPHNSKRGFWFSHVGWLCMKKHPDVLRKGKTVDMTDIMSDPLIAFHVRYWMIFKLIFCFIIPTLIPPYFWGETWKTAILCNCFVRYCLLLNFTWSVNSFAHIWGNKPYEKDIKPVENKFVSLVAMGEGWHNYHHSFPWDYRAAEMGKFLNCTTLWLDLFSKIGWAYDLKTTSPKLIRTMIEKHGDGSHETMRSRKKLSH